MATQMLTRCLVAYSPVHHFYQVRFERAEGELQSSIILVFTIRIPNLYPKQTCLALASFNLSKGTELDAFLGVASIVGH